MVWRVNGGSWCSGVANGSTERDSKFKSVLIFIDSIFDGVSGMYWLGMPDLVYNQFLHELLRTIYHEYVHHFIPEEFVGYEKTKVDPLAVRILFALLDDEEYESWYNLFYDCYEFLCYRSVAEENKLNSVIGGGGNDN